LDSIIGDYRGTVWVNQGLYMGGIQAKFRVNSESEDMKRSIRPVHI